MSLGSNGNGMDFTTGTTQLGTSTPVDFALIEVSPDNGTTWYQQGVVSVAATNTNVRWSFGATGSGSKVYAASNTYSFFLTTGTGTITSGTTAITTATVTGLPSVTNLQVRVTLQCNSVNESWIIDNVQITGTLSTTAPTVTTTSSASLITTTGATLGGNITATGGANATETGIFHSTTSGFANGTGTKVSTTGLNVGISSISQAVTGLSPGTTYFFKAFATNSAGSGYGGEQSFITVPSAPANPSASSVTPNSFNTSWPAVTGAASYRLDASTASDFSSFVSGYENLTVSGTSQVIAGLSSATTYYVRVRAVNAGGVSANSTSLTQATDAVTGEITTSGSLAAMTSTYGNPSAEGNFVVSGTGLSGNLTVTAPSGFEVSVTSGSGFGPTASITASGTLGDTTVYVRLSGSAVAGPYSGNVAISGGSATTVNVAASGTVSKATPSISVAPSATAITYLQTLASSTLSGGTASVPGSFSFTNPTTTPPAGTASQSVTFTPTDTNNFSSASISVDVVVNKATPIVSVAPTASAITFGQTLASSNLTGGTASVPGTFAFTAPSTAPGVGTASQSVTFTPNDSTNYNTATTSTNVTVNGATPPVLTAAIGATVNGTFSVTFTDIGTWQASISGITVGGTTLSSGAYNSTVAGTITFTPSASALLQSAGSKSIVISSTGYTGASLTQNIAAGIANKLFVSTQPTAPATNSAVLAVQPIVLIRDQYNNLTSSTASVTATVASGTWTLGGTTVVSASSGTAIFSGLTASSAAAVTGATISFTSTGLTGITSTTFNIPAPDFISITAVGTPVTENFDGMGSAATATLPIGFKIGTDYITGTGATTLAYGTSGTGIVTGSSSGGTINWANGVTASATDRALGFLTTGSFTSPRSVICAIRNTTGQAITSLQLSWTYEKYRSGSRAFDWTFFHGSTSTVTNSATAGNESYPADANNNVVSDPPLSVSKSATLTGLNIAAGSTYYLRWTYTGVLGSTNAQGLGIDNFSVAAITAPNVTTGSAASIVQTTATLGGSIAATGGANATERGVFISTTGGFADGTGIKVSAVGSFGAGAYTVNASNLTAATTYFFKAFATNPAGTAYGTEGTFTTLAKETPTIANAPTASAITYPQTLASSALSGGTASVPGTFAFTTPSTAPNAGTASQGVTFTPTDTGSYNIATTTVNVTVNPATLAPATITITNNNDGTYSATTASGSYPGGYSISYSGRAGTVYGPSGTAPTAPGLYTVTASPSDPNYTGSNSQNYFISGAIAVNDAVTRQAGSASIKIPVATLLGNDSQVTVGGQLLQSGLSISSVTAGTDNSVSISGAFVFYTPSTPADSAPLTFTYVLSNGTATTAIGTVTVSTVAATTFTLEFLRLVSSTYDSGANTTAITVELAGVPGQNYTIEYSTNISGWSSLPAPVSTGSTGTFNVSLTALGNVSNMFFRATR